MGFNSAFKGLSILSITELAVVHIETVTESLHLTYVRRALVLNILIQI
jgi:hypothetical protein